MFARSQQSTPFKLRPYQAEAVAANVAMFSERGSNPLTVLPTGSGKGPLTALIGGEFIRRRGQRVIVATHVKELVTQNYQQVRRIEPNLSCGIYSASIGRRDRTGQFTIANVQSICRVADQFRNVGLLQIDECHLLQHGDDGQYHELIRGLRVHNPDLIVAGLTATPWRLNSGNLTEPYKGIQPMFNEIAYEIGMAELVSDGYLTRIIARSTSTRQNTSGVQRRGGEFIAKELDAAVNVDKLNVAITDEVLDLAHDRNHILDFCVSVDHAKRVAETYRAKGIEAAYVSGDMDGATRDRVIGQFKSGRLRALSNCGILTTGFDYPSVDCIVHRRPTNCLDMETEVLTSHGWKGADDIHVGDCAASFDLETGQGSWSSVLGKTQPGSVATDASDFMISYAGTHINFRVTGNHNMVYRHCRSDSDSWSMISAFDLSRFGDLIEIPTAIEIERPDAPLTDAELHSIGMAMADGSVSGQAASISQSDGCEEFSTALMNVSRRQFLLLLSGMLDGDADHSDVHGNKRLDGRCAEHSVKAWSLCTSRKIVADRVQALAVTHGFSCSVAEECGPSRKGRAIYIVKIKPVSKRFIAARGVGDGRQRMIVEKACSSEPVWCVETEKGTLVTRRRGKVSIVGNSPGLFLQIAGRGTRVVYAPGYDLETRDGRLAAIDAGGKRDCLMLDFAQNTMRHGLVDAVTGIFKKGKEADASDNIRECVSCHAFCASDAKVCHSCGHEFPTRGGATAADREAKLGTKNTADAAMSTALEEFQVLGMRYSIHAKEGKIPTFKVSFSVPGEAWPISEWWCFNHDGWAQKKARAQWRKFADGRKPPSSVNEAISRANDGELRHPSRIWARRNGSFWTIEGVRFDGR